MGPKKRKLIDDEAECAEDDLSESSEDDDDSSLDGFIVADGELSDSNYDMEDSEKEEPVPVAAPKKRGRPPGPAKSAAKTKADAFKPPGDSSYPANDFSLTVTKSGGDVARDAIERIAEFIEKHCVKGGVSTEVGQRVFNLHLQGLFRIHWPVRKEYVQRLQKILKSTLPENGKLYKVLVKPFRSNQTFSAMIGYITKDQGKNR